MSLQAASDNPNRRSLGGSDLLRLFVTYFMLAVVDAFAVYLIYVFAVDGVIELAITVAVVTIGANIINLRQGLYPLRWIAPALSLMVLMVVYPIVYTVYVSFTNYGDGNLLTKQQVIRILSQETYLPEGGEVYAWTIYANAAGDYALWLTDRDAGDRYYFATLGGFAAVDAVAPGAELPAEYQGYRLLDRRKALQAAVAAEDLVFGGDEIQIGIAGRREAGEFEQRLVYQPEEDAILDRQTDSLYHAEYNYGTDETTGEPYKTGQFINDAGETLRTGFIAGIGTKNFVSFIENDQIRGPLIRIFLWTIGFSFASVVSTFALGLFFALIMQDERIPMLLRKFFRTVLIIPWAIPGLISVAVWRGMLNENLGVISNIIRAFGLEPPPFFIDPGWAKMGILLINLWLGYPYFMLVCSGALAAIPSDMYEAAEVDGANWWRKFRDLTLPMLLVAVGPLLIASFTFNFNNFTIIEAYDEGGPPMRESGNLPAGHTDILISYAFRLAFGAGRGADYGLASAITIVIFVMVAAVTLLQYRFTSGWEETSENV
ncbi:MAG: ABC transporter permease subunit [Chloroflexi bacterium]|nr:ABC transporter permease subunit [Chloroflexota bacterium]MCY3583435.1 ABC transporter permease subunit [Chloroflexota bacterium]MCY3715382.1 ABC transporter permease subunit [Chloroflexota bacterium]MDE2649591.1 ABC transporter permease subunit [Chloroflexota bacterium]MYC54204.1 ABC transporter permease subunit [Chloroflexota bacterium]